MSTANSPTAWSLDDFLYKLFRKKGSHHTSFSDPSNIPSWAQSCSHLLYSSKSIPKFFSESNKLYLCYEGTASSVGLVGETEDKKRINRHLSVETKGSTVIVRSKHLTLKDGDKDKQGSLVTFEGKGSSFQDAISNYFSHSDLQSASYKFSVNNIQGEGDAFLLKESHLEDKEVINHIVTMIKKLFDFVPKDNHPTLCEMAAQKVKSCPNLKKLSGQYDIRLWALIDYLCKHFDFDELEDERKPYRDHLIAECCTHLMKGIDVVSQLEEYFNILKMHNEIISEHRKEKLSEPLRKLLEDYKKQNFMPEVKPHHESIRHYHKRVSETK